MNNSIIYALDFDGVICDSAVETAITGWKCAGQIWNDMSGPVPSQSLIDQFRLVRPIIETGYEAILAMRLLHLGETTDAIYNDYAAKTQALMQDAQVTVNDLKKLFGETRDAWIDSALAEWVDMNPLFSGIGDKLRRLDRQGIWYIITTKQERFVKQILKANQIDLPDAHIFGLDRNMSKQEVLKGLLKKHPDRLIHFVEDRLPTLLNVLKNEELASVKLIFALWGYSTDEDKAIAAQNPLNSRLLDDFLI
ncbi:HAD family hydrolase [Methylobacter sp. YRD-M1]|uniref:HAD family hydrolase n=1 Tax=Methylobacter sp. YRD-M1 TaxID=2911520 RepID=UPI00227B7406|nr:HAD family hydrolase [Methylobacter sp. YRD-M1]WAK03475.1 HAD family hydrolase [Methylobacter sp. YRD-M1]